MLYGNGEAFRKEARKRKALVTDKTVSLHEFIPNENFIGYQIEYSLGGLLFNVIISDLIKGQTVQQDLLWVNKSLKIFFLIFRSPEYVMDLLDFLHLQI